MDKGRKLAEFSLMEEFACSLKFKCELADPSNHFKLLFPSKKASDLHHPTLSNLNVLARPNLYLPATLNLDIGRVNFISNKVKAGSGELTLEEEEILEVPRVKKPGDHTRTSLPVPIGTVEPISHPTTRDLPLRKKSFDRLTDFLGTFDDFVNDPREVLLDLEAALRKTFKHNVGTHSQRSQQIIADQFPDLTVLETCSIGCSNGSEFTNEKVVLCTLNLLNKTSKIKIPDLAVITLGEDNQRALSLFHQSTAAQTVYDKFREYVFYVPGEQEKRPTGAPFNFFRKIGIDQFEVISINHIFDIRKENKNFVKNSKWVDDQLRLQDYVPEHIEPETPVSHKSSEPDSDEDSLDQMIFE